MKPTKPWRTKRCGNCAEWFATQHLARRYCDGCKPIVRRRTERKRRRRLRGIPPDKPIGQRTFVYRPPGN